MYYLFIYAGPEPILLPIECSLSTMADTPHLHTFYIKIIYWMVELFPSTHNQQKFYWMQVLNYDF